jgi:predicted transcriptional regulator
MSLSTIRKEEQMAQLSAIREEVREQLTYEALADVDAGRVIDHQQVLVWAESLGTDDPLPELSMGE